MLHTKMSEDSILSDDSASETSSTQSSSPVSPSSQFALFSSDSPPLFGRESPDEEEEAAPLLSYVTRPPAPEIFDSQVQLLEYQESDAQMYDPWLVRVVLDLYDVRGFDWMVIAEPIERVWGFRTNSADVLGILSANGRLNRLWWD